MNLYNIHTHKIAPADSGYNEVCILNTYPYEFHSEKIDSENVFYSCGIHPWYVKDVQSDFDLLTEIVRNDKIVAVGEAGLDKLQGAALDIQIKVFRMQIELAIETNKPLIIHCVKAWDELIALFKEYKTAIPWIIHGYRGNAVQTEQLGKIGLKFSIGEKFNPESLKYIPLESLFCETDMSDYTISNVYDAVSDTLNMDKYHFADIIEVNIRKNFKILTK